VGIQNPTADDNRRNFDLLHVIVNIKVEQATV
jgi:hypothetical protein